MSAVGSKRERKRPSQGLGELAARLRPYIQKRVPKSDVDDVLQDVFVRLQQHRGSLRDEERFGSWAYRITRSTVADYHRALRRHPPLADEPSEVAAMATDDDNDGRLAVELATYVGPVMAMLPLPYREALTLTELEGLTQNEAAKMLGISASGMKSRVQRGRARLRELLEDCCIIALDVRGRIISCEPRSSEGISNSILLNARSSLPATSATIAKVPAPALSTRMRWPSTP